MAHTTLISCDALQPLLGRDDLVLFDCRHQLMDPAYGRKAYDAEHMPGALYADMDHDLAAPATKAEGRHPLPDLGAFATWLGRMGVGDGVQVVAYDDGPGSAAARLWWMLRYLGHEAVAVLDGGLKAWLAAGGSMARDIPTPTPRTFTARPQADMVSPLADVLAHLEDGNRLLIDARTAERFEGKSEPIDPVAGHIPGAVNRPYPQNLAPDGRFLPADQLREHFAALLGGTDPVQAVHYCGSGVSAAHNVLAQAHAGLGTGRLYPGSWSQWVGDAARPVATGPSSR